MFIKSCGNCRHIWKACVGCANYSNWESQKSDNKYSSDAEIFKSSEKKFIFHKDEYIRDCMKGSIHEAERVGHRWDKGSLKE